MITRIKWLSATCIAAVVLFVLGGVWARYDAQTGFTSLIRFGEFFEGKRIAEVHGLPLAVAPNAGYDGQFYAQLAVNPDVTSENVRQAMDMPSYRARRMLLPAIAHVLGFGDAWRTLQMYALLNVAAWIALAFVWWREVQESKRETLHTTAVWAACMLSLGTLDSVRMALTDLPATLLLVFAVRAGCRNRSWLAGLCFAAAGFAKETSMLAVFSLNPRDGGRLKKWFWRTAWVAPVAAWCFWLMLAIPNESTGVRGNFDWPGFALARHLAVCVREISGGNMDSRYVFGFIGALCLGYQSVYVLVRWRKCPSNPWVRIAVPFALLFWILGEHVLLGYWAATRACLPLTFAFNRLLLSEMNAQVMGAKLVAGNLYILHSAYRFLPF